MSYIYECAVCHEEFSQVDGWTDEDAYDECRARFGVGPEDVPCSLVCDDCYQQLLVNLCN